MTFRHWPRVPFPVSGECEQVANAKDSFVDLTPASDASAVATRAAWAALLPQPEVEDE
jgi:hypothetical protein